MESNYQFLLTVGGILLLGLLTTTIGRRTPLPRVTLLLMFGVCIGSDGFDIIPAMFVDWFELIANMALLMVGFLLGGQLTRRHLATATGEVFWFSLVAAVVTAVITGIVVNTVEGRSIDASTAQTTDKAPQKENGLEPGKTGEAKPAESKQGGHWLARAIHFGFVEFT